MTLAIALRRLALVPLLLVAAGCASRPRQPAVLVPPKLDLARYSAIGIGEFASNEAPPVGTSATAAFLSAVHSAQPGTPLLELGAIGRVDPAAIRKLAAREHVDAIWIGELVEGMEQPRLTIDALYKSGSASARRKASLAVRLYDGRTGATVWSSASERTIPVMGISGSVRGVSDVHTRPMDEARSILIRDLVTDVTCDLRPTWVRP